MKTTRFRFLSCLLACAALFDGGTALAAEVSVPLDACTINGSVYVKLEDAAQAAGFTYTYNAATNSVIINPEEASSAVSTVKAGLTRNADGSINVPQDGSLYTPPGGRRHPLRRRQQLYHHRCEPVRWEHVRRWSRGAAAGAHLRLVRLRPAGAAQSGGPPLSR